MCLRPSQQLVALPIETGRRREGISQSQIGSKVSSQQVIHYRQQAGDEDRKHRKLEPLATSLLRRMSEALLASSFLRDYARE